MRSPFPIHPAGWFPVVVLASCLVATPLAAQDQQFGEEPDEFGEEPEQDVQVYQDWRVQCGTGNDGQRCVMFQNLVYGDSNQTILSVQIGRNAATQQTAAVFIVPLGVILPPGVSMEVDGGPPAEIDYERCTPQVCVAPLPLDETLLATLKRGLEAQVTFQAVVQGNRRPITVPVSLKGFTAAFNQIR